MSIRSQLAQTLRDLADVLTPWWPYTRREVPLALLAGAVITALEVAAAWVLGVLALGAVGFVTRTDLLGVVDDWNTVLQGCTFVATTALLLSAWATVAAVISADDEAKRLRRTGGGRAR